MKPQWTPLREAERSGEYRVTVSRIPPGRFRGFNRYLEDRHGRITAAVLGLIFGIDTCVSIYDHGRFVGRQWASKGLNSPKRVAERLIRHDINNSAPGAQSALYSVAYSRDR